MLMDGREKRGEPPLLYVYPPGDRVGDGFPENMSTVPVITLVMERSMEPETGEELDLSVGKDLDVLDNL